MGNESRFPACRKNTNCGLPLKKTATRPPREKGKRKITEKSSEKMPVNQDEYNTGILIPALIKDPVLSGGYCEKLKNGSPQRYAGGFCVVYPFNVRNRKYAVRCWCNEVPDARVRAEKISAILKRLQLPCFVEFEYVARGIMAAGRIRPIVRMDWVKGEELKDYILRHKRDASALYRLAGEFRKMMSVLHANHLSHGDLQHGNIKVKCDGSIVLVDYDSLYHPSMGRLPDTILGLPSYQHPLRHSWQYASERADCFSELIIYTSLLCFAVNPRACTDRIYQSEGLLFEPEDYQPTKIMKSQAYRDLYRYSKETQFLADKIAYACCNARSFDDIPTLETVLKEGEDRGLRFDRIPLPAGIRIKLWQENMAALRKLRHTAAWMRNAAAAILHYWPQTIVVTAIFISAAVGGYNLPRYSSAKKSWQTHITTADNLLRQKRYTEALASCRSALALPYMNGRKATVELKIQEVNAVIAHEVDSLLQELPPLLDAYNILKKQYMRDKITVRLSRIREIQPEHEALARQEYKPFI
jgi:serine/threonine protein kinase